jgi:hypothetical protein
MTDYVYIVRCCEAYEGCTNRLATLDFKKARDCYIELAREIIRNRNCYMISYHQSGIFSSGWEILQVELDKEYDHDFDEDVIWEPSE